jgi:hypothetical protein
MTAAFGGPEISRLEHASQLLEQPIDPLRTVCLPFAEEDTARAALIGLANAGGGEILLGVRADEDRARIVELPGVDSAWFDQHLERLTAEVDPPAAGLVGLHVLSLPRGSAVGVLSVRQSPTPPHLDTTNGTVYLHQHGAPRPVRSRVELDRLYLKGRALDERAERLIEATAERLTLAHFGHYGVAVVACLREPSAEPFLWARAHPEAFADPADSFVHQWGFAAKTTRVSTGEVELRNEREISGLLRVGRAGYVVAGEILKRPQGDVLASTAEVCEHLERLVTSACRILVHSDATAIVPRLLCDGLKGAKIRREDAPGSESKPSLIDVLRIQGPAGNPSDAGYRRQLTGEFGRAFLAPFGLSDLADESL